MGERRVFRGGFSEGFPEQGDIGLSEKLKEHSEKAMRYNDGKLKWSLVHFESLHPLVKVLMYGAKKYAPHNWKKPMNKEEILESMMRHLTFLMDGYETDFESGESHIGHIMCNCMFWQYHNETTQSMKA